MKGTVPANERVSENEMSGRVSRKQVLKQDDLLDAQ